MPRTPAKRPRPRLDVEPLEARSLLATALTVTAELAATSDPDGNGVVLRPTAVVEGQTAPGARVTLRADGGAVVRATHAGAGGFYRFRVSLPVGRSNLQVHASDRAGQSATAGLLVTRADAVIDWNTTALDAVRVAATNPPLAARNLAMVQLAVFDAVNAIDPRSAPYGGFPVLARRGASPVAAVAGAADEVLRSLYPQQAPVFGAALAESLATVPNGLARARGLTVGRAAGDAILALRADDGAGAFVDAPPATRPGQWQPTPPGYGKPVGLNFAFVTPFAMTSPSEFLPPPPPALDSPAYAAAYNEVKSVGAADSTTRTPDETAMARFWADLSGETFTPPGHWNQIAQDAALARRLTLPAEARLFALLDVALADAGISCWDTKDVYDAWRPVTAIRAGDSDGNPLTAGDSSWTPLWPTPSFPSYTSGHATFSAAAAAVLDSTFGSSYAFTDRGDPMLGLPSRHFNSFDQAAAEAAASRMYGGIHFRFDNETGLAVGSEIGNDVVQTQLLPLPNARKGRA